MTRKILSITLVCMLFLSTAYYARAEDITPTGMSQRALVQYLTDVKNNYNLLRNQMLNRCFGYAGLRRAAASAAAIDINPGGASATPLVYSIAGVNYATPGILSYSIAGTGTHSAGYFAKYLVSINASGAITITKGTETATDAAVLPALPSANAPLGYFYVYSSSALTWGSSSIPGTGGATFYSLSVMNGGSSASADLALTGL